MLNRIRELFAVDRDDFLIPIHLFAKLLPSLKEGLKMIGIIKKVATLKIPP